MKYEIQANPTGTRSLQITESNLETINKYALFSGLVDSTGIIDDDVLEKLKMNIRSLITSQENDSKDLLDLCLDVIYHNDIKAFGLHKLVVLYVNWKQQLGDKEE